MDITELEQAAMKAMTEDGPLAAARLFHEAYESTVATIRNARESQDTSVKTKQVLEAMEISDDAEQAAQSAMDEVRVAVFGGLSTNMEAAVLLYDFLRDYVANEVKDFRDDIIRRAKRDLALPEEDVEEVELPNISTDDLKSLREKADAFWTVAGKPAVEPDEEDEAALSTKALKDGSLKLAFSNLPKNLEGGENGSADSSDTKDKSVRHSRLRYEVDGEIVDAGTPLSAVGLWYISSPNWTVSVEDIKRAVEKSTGEKYKDVGDFEVEVNGRLLRRFRENI